MIHYHHLHNRTGTAGFRMLMESAEVRPSITDHCVCVCGGGGGDPFNLSLRIKLL